MDALLILIFIISLISHADRTAAVSIAHLALDDGEVHTCSYQGNVKCFTHDASVTEDGGTLMSDFSSAMKLGFDAKAEEAALALATLQDASARERLQNLDVNLVFVHEKNIAAYAALEIPKLLPQIMPVCVAHEAVLRWSVEECAADVVLQVQAYIISQACRSREYTPNLSDLDNSAATCDARLAIETGPQRYIQANDPSFVFIDAGALGTVGNVENVLGITEAVQISLRQRIWEELIKPRLFGNFWTTYYDDVVAFLAKYHSGVSSDGQQVRIVEVGTCYGGLADRLAGELRGAHVYAVDPFEVDYDSNDLTSADRNRWFKSWLNATDQKLNEDEAAEAAFFSNAWADALAEKLHERHGCRAHVVPLRSTDASLLFDDHSVDSVFIDGLHTYEGVAADVFTWLPKLKSPGGSLIFNDFGSDHFPGVTRAVTEMIRSRNWSAVVYGDFGTPPGIQNVALVL